MIRPNKQTFEMSSSDDKFQKRANILFNHPDNEKNIKKQKPKNLPLGKSIYDEEDEDDNSEKNIKIEKSDENDKTAENKTERKSRKDRTEDEEQEILDLMFPSMKDIEKKKKGNLTDGAVNIDDSILNDDDTPKKEGINNHFDIKIEKKIKKQPEENIDTTNKQTENIANTDQKEKNKAILKIMGVDDDKYVLEGDTISSKYDIVNNVKYQKDDEKAQEIKNNYLFEKNKNNPAKRIP